MLCIGNAHADEQLKDLAGRIEYGFYAADQRELQQSVRALETLQVAPAELALRDGYLNYGRWKLAQRLASTDAAQAQQLAEACADAITTAKSGAVFAMHQALRAACLGMLEQLRPLRSAVYRLARNKALQQARQAQGKMPEVQLVSAWLAMRKDQPESAYQQFTQAVQQYAATEIQADADMAAHWGHAEACYWAGRAEAARGNALAARNLLERALVLAPDYRDAWLLLRSLHVK